MNRFAVLALLAVGMTGAQAASTVALYEFNGNFDPASGVGSGASALVSVDPLAKGAFINDTVNGIARTVFRFDGAAFPSSDQGGLQFVNADLMSPNSYSIEAYFSFDAVSGWRRIIDTRDRTEDTGFYVLNGGLQLYPSNVGQGTFGANVYNHVILSFDGSTAVAYLDGIAQSTQSTDYYSLPASNVISLFLDNTVSVAPNEYSAGKIAWARFYDGALNADEALAAYRSAIDFEVPSPVPEPSTYALMLAGVAAVMLVVQRRRHTALS